MVNHKLIPIVKAFPLAKQYEEKYTSTTKPKELCESLIPPAKLKDEPYSKHIICI